MLYRWMYSILFVMVATTAFGIVFFAPETPANMTIVIVLTLTLPLLTYLDKRRRKSRGSR